MRLKNNMSEQLNILDAIRTVVKEELQPFRNEVKNFKNEVLTHVDAVMHEVKTMREEQSAVIHTLTDHEKRIDKLEVRVGV